MATNTDEIKSLKKNIKKITEEKEELVKEIEEIKKMLASANSVQQTQTPIIINDSDRDVLFTSLYPGLLNLSTEGYGNGDIYTFDHFGDEQNIPYSHAKQIIRNNKSFITGGYVFINDDELVRSERLESQYKKILNKEKILKTFSLNKTEFKQVFENMTDAQKEILRQVVTRKMSDGQDVDMNIVDMINKELNCNIGEEIKNGEGLGIKE